MSTATLCDPLVPNGAPLPMSRPRSLATTVPTHAVSFGFGNLRPVKPSAPLDLDSFTYRPDLGYNVGPDGRPAVDTIQCGTSTQSDTKEDMQTWTDNDTDK